MDIIINIFVCYLILVDKLSDIINMACQVHQCIIEGLEGYK